MGAFTKVSQIMNITRRVIYFVFVSCLTAEESTTFPRASLFYLVKQFPGTGKSYAESLHGPIQLAGGSLRHNKLFMSPSTSPPTPQSPGPSDPKLEIREHSIFTSLLSYKIENCTFNN